MGEVPLDVCTKIERLIRDHFPGGLEDPLQPGQVLPFSPAVSEAQRKIVEGWLVQQCVPYRVVALALLARIWVVLRELEAMQNQTRLVARVDATALVKSPESILEKMAREWDGSHNPKIGFGNLDELEDLGRFRIVTNFLSDARQIADRLAASYNSALLQLSPGQQALRKEFQLKGNNLDDSIHLAPGERTKGERCYKGVFYPQDAMRRHLRLEVQVQTQLQEAWDKKDHFLIYEPRRRGEPIDDHHAIEMFAMSELLYVADLTFDRLRTAIESKAKTPRRRKN